MSIDLFVGNEIITNTTYAIGIFVVALIFRKMMTKYVFQFLLKIGKKTPTEVVTHLLLSFERPIRWFFVVIGIYIAIDFFPFLNQSHPIIVKLFRSCIIVLITWGLFNLASVSSLLFSKINKQLRLNIDEMIIPFLSKGIRFVIVGISLSIIAQEFNYDVNGFIAGMGLGGLAIALAAKDAIGNLFGWVIIITEKPFSIGDWIQIGNVEGTVEEIELRSTKIRTFSHALVTVPNTIMANDTITNFSQMGKRRITFTLGLTYQTPREKIQKVVTRLNQLLRNHEEIHQETIFVTFDKYNDSSLDIFVYFFTKTIIWKDYLQIKHEINMYILEILEEEKVDIAFPSRTLYMSSGEENSNEVNKVRLPIKNHG